MASHARRSTPGSKHRSRIIPSPDVTGSSQYTEQDHSPIPTVNERLGHLRPSKELLEYYRKKIAEFDDEHEEMVLKLDQYKMTYEEKHKLQWAQRQREEEIAELQKALSDMQVYLFQEREHVLRLYSENDRLKIQELEDRKKIHQLLALCGKTEGEISYFLKEPPAKAIVPQQLPRKLQQVQTAADVNLRKASGPSKRKPQNQTSSHGEQRLQRDTETLMLHVEALQSQLEEQTKLAKEHIEALLEDRRVKIEENETRRERDADKIQILNEKLKKTQDILYDSTKDFLQLRYEGRSQERHWMAEKDSLLRELDVCKQELNISRDNILHVSDDVQTRQMQNVEIQGIQSDLEQAQKLSDMYREQVIQLEDELSRIREEGDVSKDIFKDRTDKMTKRLNLMNQRYQELEKRRNLEVEGFKNDIKNLRSKLKDVEKQLYKVTLGFGEDIDKTKPDDVEMAILRNVRRTAGRSKALIGDLRHLKGRIYGLENDLRHL